ncbi:alpha/beta-hydrolase [Trichoderma asperelloides]|nr:alpha/beta-hydrolase [Trichoderma asperelloides]
MTQRPVLIMIHGGGHSHPKYFETLQSLLQAEGFSTVTGTNPSDGAINFTPGRSFYDDATYWREKILSIIDNDQDVVVFMHSVASLVGIEAAKGLTKTDRAKSGKKGGVAHLIFLAGYLPNEGDTVFDFYNGPRGNCPTRALNGTDVLDIRPYHDNYYSDMDKVERDYWKQYISYQTLDFFTLPITHATWKDVPCSWIYTELDDIIPVDIQKQFILEAKRDSDIHIRTFSLPSGHSPFLNMPDKVVEIIQTVYDENQL